MPKLKKWIVPFSIKGKISVTSTDRASASKLVSQMTVSGLIAKAPVLSLHVEIDKTAIDGKDELKTENIFKKIMRRFKNET